MPSAKRYISNIMLVVASIIVGLYLAEACLLIKDCFNRHSEEGFDPRTKYEVYQALKRRVADISIYVSPTHWRDEKSPFYPLSGLSHRKTIHCNENGYYSIYASDRYGFNNPDVEWSRTPTDFLLIGDSFAQGACVNEPETVSGNLRALSGKSVLTLGMGGNGPLSELALLREYLPITKAKSVFWLYFEGNDLVDLNLELENKILKQYLESKDFSQELAAQQIRIDQQVTTFIHEWEKKNGYHATVQFLTLETLRHFLNEQSKSIFATSASISDFKKVLTEASNTVSSENAKLFFVFIPSRERYRGKLKSSEVQSEIIKLTKELNIPVIDIHAELLKQTSGPLSFFSKRHGYHLNEKGYQLIAKALLNYHL